MQIIGEFQKCKLIEYPNGDFVVQSDGPKFMTLVTRSYYEAIEYFLAQQKKAASVGAETAN